MGLARKRINAKPPGPTARARKARAAKRQREYKAVCAQIDQEHAEDGGVICVRCKRWVAKPHHHHIKHRSTNPELRTVKSNIEPLCADCHAAEHA